MIDALKIPIARVMELLVQENYYGLEAFTGATRLRAVEMQQAVEEYGRTLITPPEVGYDIADVVQVFAAQVPTWSVTMPLWTSEEGRSDLTAEMTIIIRDDGPKVELDNIHVL